MKKRIEIIAYTFNFKVSSNKIDAIDALSQNLSELCYHHRNFEIFLNCEYSVKLFISES